MLEDRAAHSCGVEEHSSVLFCFLDQRALFLNHIHSFWLNILDLSTIAH